MDVVGVASIGAASRAAVASFPFGAITHFVTKVAKPSEGSKKMLAL